MSEEVSTALPSFTAAIADATAAEAEAMAALRSDGEEDAEPAPWTTLAKLALAAATWSRAVEKPKARMPTLSRMAAAALDVRDGS
jgi:hypothetical protein